MRIRKALEIDQFVKNKPAAILKEAADASTGSQSADQQKPDGCGCPSERLKQAVVVK
jgi:hypothetical protein